MAQGKAFALVEIKKLVGNSDQIAAIVSFTGGATNPITRDVPSGDYGGNTTIKEPTGGLEYEDFEFSFQERLEDEIELDAIYEAVQEWKKGTDPKEYRKDLDIVFFRDADYQNQIARLVVTGAWCTACSNIEFDRSSNDNRSFTATVAHKGSEYKKTGNSGIGTAA
jgi:hypothetical protein